MRLVAFNVTCSGGDPMSYLEKLDWNKVKADVEKGLEQGLVAIKSGAMVVKKKSGELSDEGKRQYKLMSLKAKVHKGMYELGTRVYSLTHSGRRNPLLDAKVKDITAQIRKNEATIVSLEKTLGKTGGTTRKKKA
jgi:hypothetical protein